jgi:hypothetical protein
MSDRNGGSSSPRSPMVIALLGYQYHLQGVAAARRDFYQATGEMGLAHDWRANADEVSALRLGIRHLQFDDSPLEWKKALTRLEQAACKTDFAGSVQHELIQMVKQAMAYSATGVDA